MGTDVKKYRRELQAQDRAQVSSQFQLTAYSGILPPPDYLAKYEQIEPGITNRLLATYEKQVDHRIKIEEAVINDDIRRANIGQIFGFIFLISVTAVSFVAVFKGFEIAGIAGVITSLGSLFWAYYRAYGNRKKELENKK